MDTPTLIGIGGVLVATFTAGWGVIQHFSVRRYQNNRAREEAEKAAINERMEAHVSEGKGYIDNLKDRIDQKSKYDTQQFAAIRGDHESLEKRVGKLESIQITEDRVEEMLDVQTQPLRTTLTKLEEVMEKEFKEIKESQALTDMTNQRLLMSTSKIEGYLQAQNDLKNREE